MTAEKFRISDLRERVTLEVENQEASLGGGYTRSSEVLGLTWAAVQALSSETIKEGGQNRRKTFYEVIVRQRPRVEDVRRILWQGRTLKVSGLVAQQRKGFVRFSCEETAAL